MRVTLLGKRKVDFVTADDSRRINGTSIFYGYEMDGVDGMIAEKAFVPAEKVAYKDLVVGSDINIDFNIKGRIMNITEA